MITDIERVLKFNNLEFRNGDTVILRATLEPVSIEWKDYLVKIKKIKNKKIEFEFLKSYYVSNSFLHTIHEGDKITIKYKDIHSIRPSTFKDTLIRPVLRYYNKRSGGYIRVHVGDDITLRENKHGDDIIKSDCKVLDLYEPFPSEIANGIVCWMLLDIPGEPSYPIAIDNSISCKTMILSVNSTCIAPTNYKTCHLAKPKYKSEMIYEIQYRNYDGNKLDLETDFHTRKGAERFLKNIKTKPTGEIIYKLD